MALTSTESPERRVIEHSFACPNADACLVAIQARVSANWHIMGVERARDGGFVIRFRRNEAITPFFSPA